MIEIPASALTRSEQQPAVWVVDPASQTVALRPVEVERFGEYLVAIADGLKAGDVVVTAGVQALHPGQKVRLLETAAMSGFNLSEWALKHRSITIYLMILAVLAGLASYYRLGRSEDPSFIIKTMVVQAQWPGATIEETLKQVTERLERTLQETPHLDFLRSFTRAGVSTIFVNLDGKTNAAAGGRHLVPRAQERSATCATPCPPACSARASTTTSATPSASSMASRRTASPTANCATMSRRCAPSC